MLDVQARPWKGRQDRGGDVDGGSRVISPSNFPRTERRGGGTAGFITTGCLIPPDIETIFHSKHLAIGISSIAGTQ